MTIYILSIFLSAYLLFQVQPLMGKLLLPWFGGAPAVWSTLMMFFQVMLTGGYAYAYWLIGQKKVANQRKVHSALIGVSAVILIFLVFVWPSGITPSADWKPTNIANPVFQIFSLLAISVGLPYFVLATNSTLVQVWFSSKHPGRSAYWLYAFSNFGSLLALLIYPVFIEPSFAVHTQGSIWVFGYFGFVILTLVILFGKVAGANLAIQPELQEATPEQGVNRSLYERILWVGLSATASILLLAVTNQLMIDLAPIPFLWVIPMSVYLLSFILSFSGRRIYHRPIFSLLLVLSSVAVIYLLFVPSVFFGYQIVIYSIFLFAACMVAHGELYQIRPGVLKISQFYLLVSIGGALGGVVVNLIGPAFFSYYWEFYLGWGLILILLTILTFTHKTDELRMPWRFIHDVLIGSASIAVVIISFFAASSIFSDNLFFDRNFFGTLRVKVDENEIAYSLIHGTTIHGFQFISPEDQDIPTSYYWEGSGVGQLLRNFPRTDGNIRVGVLGLGAGVLSAYGQPGDEYIFYEINPMVVDLAEGDGGYFSFLSNSAADVSVVLGDARLSLENELAQGQMQGFDVLVLDIFSGDSIPTHLLTKEAFQLYQDRLAPGGVIALHISNRYLDLTPIIWQLVDQYDMYMGMIWIIPDEDELTGSQNSKWILVSNSPDIFELPEIRDNVDRLEGYSTDIRMWTDDYSNLFQILIRD